VSVKRWYVLACVLSGLRLSAHAVEPIDTDGPDFVESSEVVPTGRFQYEVGWTSLSQSSVAPDSALVATPMLLKFGIAKDFEFRLAPSGFMRQNGDTAWGDLAVGMKWHTQDRAPALGRAAVSWILHIDTPSGAHPFKGKALRPSLRSVMTWDLPGDFALGLMPGIKSDTGEDGHRFTALILGAVLNKRLSDTTRVFVELSAPQIATPADGGVIASWDVGTAYLFNNDLQLGLRLGVGANHNSPRHYGLIELAQRF
jgi:hypothetical protein